MTTDRTLIIVGHPNLADSRANAARIAEIENLGNVTVHDLYQNYPDFGIDVAREQQLLREHDTVILQFPLCWYSVTPLVKSWFDVVLNYGFAFTLDGSASELRGKKAWLAVSVGSSLDTYTTEGVARRSLDEYLAPVRQTLEFCQFDYQGVHAVYGMMLNPSEDELILDAKEYGRLVASNGTPVG
ncbi:NAD(P)H-dependent oxidoreductase [Paenarthrobacter nitroguajacolicus]|uniref:NAD(P)H-dependent oxidoreductase n=1 Tax=Paenarthrobacter nitroguajacolicus TaxID=211146 RepID=UPI00248B63AD|nr:NAD(P)H-dependent oxidoreductase [Paenarthrobacter nitroguajacolicus]MDI2033294.1 General stress protein 14 [Paenarthrobacter nitroguajacolicus]